MKDKKKTKLIKVEAKKDNVLAFTINKEKEQVVYYLRGTQSKIISKIIINGFTEIPTGIYLNRSGYGFTTPSGGRFLIMHIEKLFNHKPIELIISKDSAIEIKDLKTKKQVIIPIFEVKNILADIKKINAEKKQEIESKLNKYLALGSKTFIKTSSAYVGGQLHSILRKEKLFEGLSEEDINEVGDFIPKFFKSDLSKKIKKQKEYKLQLAKMNKTETEKIYLDQVILEFKELLGCTKLSEQKWQEFLREKVFPFLSNYTFFIEKQRLSIKGSEPDFIAIDVYEFIDIYEIKTHNEQILAYDSSHKNYYWKPYLSQAISQVESYIDQVNDNPSSLEKYINENYGKKIKIIRPRGYIIAGQSSEFTTESQFRDFRRLSRSLKNIDFILYDELLENLKNLREKL